MTTTNIQADILDATIARLRVLGPEIADGRALQQSEYQRRRVLEGEILRHVLVHVLGEGALEPVCSEGVHALMSKDPRKPEGAPGNPSLLIAKDGELCIRDGDLIESCSPSEACATFGLGAILRHLESVLITQRGRRVAAKKLERGSNMLGAVLMILRGGEE